MTIELSSNRRADGYWPALTVKQRLISANEENGNYIVTTFLGVQAPTGQVPFTNDAWVMTPTLAAGKGGVISIFRPLSAFLSR